MPPMYSLGADPSSSSSEMYRPYSWHQSHDQATVLLMVPVDIMEEELQVIIEKNYIIAGIAGQMPIIKGRLYSNVDTANSVWQLEPRVGASTRERTLSSTSSAASSYAFVSDNDELSSFAPSSAFHSDVDSSGYPSPAVPASPALAPEVAAGRFPVKTALRSRPSSPRRDLSYSYSSLESLQSLGSGRLLTLHLEKETAAFWPSLVVGPCPDTMSPGLHNSLIFNNSHELEYQYNMDPTSLVLLGLDLFDIRRNREEAFECFLRAWHIAHVPTATVKLVSTYLPLALTEDIASLQAVSTPSAGTTSYYLQCIGDSAGLAQLYLQAGILHLEGSWHGLLSSPHASISSLRLADHGSADGWRRDREAARQLFERAHILQPSLEIPALPPADSLDLQLPSIDFHVQPETYGSDDEDATEVGRIIEKRRKIPNEQDVTRMGFKDLSDAWQVYLPGLIGAGTAVVAVGVIGILSVTWSRRNQAS